MKKFRSLKYLVGVCLVLLLIASTLVMACSPKSTSTSSSTTSTTSAVKTTTSTSTATTSTTAKTTSTTSSSAIAKSVLQNPQGMPNSGLTPQLGGTLKVNLDKQFTNIGAPWKSTGGSEKPFWRFAVECLVGLDSKGNAVPQLATSWDADPDKKTIIFTLRQGVKFHDGTDFDAAAAKWNIDMYKSGILPDLKMVTAVDVLDNTHIRITLSNWDADFISNLCYNYGGKMVSPTAAKKLIDAGKENDILMQPVGTGPFKLVSANPQTGLKFVRFDNYWQKGLPYLDAVEVKIVVDQVVSIASFTKGESHGVFWVDASYLKKLKEQGNYIGGNLATISGFAVDSKNPTSPWANIKVRQAFAHGYDNNTVVTTIYEGYKKPTNQLASLGRTAYDPTIKGYPYNPAKAQQLLAEAGYSTSNPLVTKIQYTTNALNADFYTEIQSQLKKVGINMALEPLDNATTNKLQNTGWNNSVQEFRLQYNGLEVKYTTGLLATLSNAGTRYVSVLHPDDYETYLKLTMLEVNLAKKEQMYKALNKMAVDDYCMVIPSYENVNYLVYSPKVHDLGLFDITLSEWLPEIAWLSK